MIRIPIPPYDKERLSVPWVGMVVGWNAILPKDGVLRPPDDLVFMGEWKGTAKFGGYLHPVRDRAQWSEKPGVVLRWGQRNRATGRTCNEGYGIALTSSTFKQVEKRLAWEWFVKTRSA